MKTLRPSVPLPCSGAPILNSTSGESAAGILAFVGALVLAAALLLGGCSTTQLSAPSQDHYTAGRVHAAITSPLAMLAKLIGLDIGNFPFPPVDVDWEIHAGHQATAEKVPK